MGVLDIILLVLIGGALAAALISLLNSRQTKKGCSGGCQGRPYAGNGCPSEDISE